MSKKVFDQEAAFKSIMGIQESSETSEQKPKSHQNPKSRLSELYEEVNNKKLIVNGKPESKTRRVNFLLKPSVHDAAKQKCQTLGISFNDCINQLLEQWIDS